MELKGNSFRNIRCMGKVTDQFQIRLFLSSYTRLKPCPFSWLISDYSVDQEGSPEKAKLFFLSFFLSFLSPSPAFIRWQYPFLMDKEKSFDPEDLAP